MIERRPNRIHFFLAGALLAAATGAMAQTAAPPAPDASIQARRQQMMQARLDRLGQRLEVRASQEDAWQKYSQALRSFAAPPAPIPGPNADAATLMRFRADRASARAQRMTQLADATAKLEQALDPNQRLVLDEATRRAGRAAWAHRLRWMHPGAMHRDDGPRDARTDRS